MHRRNFSVSKIFLTIAAFGLMFFLLPHVAEAGCGAPRVQGHVKKADGTPYPGIWVKFVDGIDWRFKQTDSDGFYSFESWSDKGEHDCNEDGGQKCTVDWRTGMRNNLIDPTGGNNRNTSQISNINTGDSFATEFTKCDGENPLRTLTMTAIPKYNEPGAFNTLSFDFGGLTSSGRETVWRLDDLTFVANNITLKGRVTNSATGQGIPGVVINEGVTAPPGCKIGTATTDANGYFTYTNISQNQNFCMRLPAVPGYAGPDRSYECQRAGVYANPDGCGFGTGNTVHPTSLDVGPDDQYNFIYTPLPTATPTPTPTLTPTPLPLACDFNGDRAYNDNDFDLWKKAFLGDTSVNSATRSTIAGCSGDATVDLVDFNIWRNKRYGL